MMTDGNVSGEGFQKEFRASDVWTYYGRYLSDRSDETQLAEWDRLSRY